MRLEQEAMGGSPTTVAPSPVTYAAAAAASVSGNAAVAGVPPPVPVVMSDEETKEFEDFTKWRRWNDMRKTSDGSINVGAVIIDGTQTEVSIAGPRPASSMSPGARPLFQ